MLTPLPRWDLYGESVDSALSTAVLNDFLSGLSLDELSAIHLLRPEVVEATIRDQIREAGLRTQLDEANGRAAEADERAEAAEELETKMQEAWCQAQKERDEALARITKLRGVFGDVRVSLEKITTDIDTQNARVQAALAAEKEEAKK